MSTIQIEQLEQFAAQYAQLRKDAEVCGIEWRTVILKGNSLHKGKAPAAVAGESYNVTVQLPDGFWCTRALPKPFTFCVAVLGEQGWAPMFWSSTLTVAKSRAYVARQRGAAPEHVVIMLAKVEGIAPTAPQAEPVTTTTAPSVGREAEVISKLDAGLISLIPSREMLYDKLAQLEAEQIDEDLPPTVEPLPEPIPYTDEEVAENSYVETEEITREPVEEEQQYQNFKIVGGTAVHAPDSAYFGTRCGISGREFVQTDEAVSCKSCQKALRSA